jgi:hypothetical protein
MTMRWFLRASSVAPFACTPTKLRRAPLTKASYQPSNASTGTATLSYRFWMLNACQ